MNSFIFDSQYKKLNSEQREAVDAVEGPVMVIAGPGTGKTSILTLRIANILRQTDTNADCILALTFTESGVHSMRRKLVDIIGPTGYRVHIYTFHSFCNDIIKQYPQEFPRIIGAQHMTDLDQISIMEEIIEKTKLKNLKPHGNLFYHLKGILNEIKELKREDIESDEFRRLLKENRDIFESTDDLYHIFGKYKSEMKGKYKSMAKKLDNSDELALIYEKYQATLEKKRLYDYEDMIMEVIRVLRINKNLLLELQEMYQYILADEHQDANNAQNKLLELISGFHENPNLFIVGDEKQAIFRFQGASLENFLYFKKRFKNSRLITLRKNYRSTQIILDASQSLIERNRATLSDTRIKLESSSQGEQASIKLYEFESVADEENFIAQDVHNKIKSGINPHSIAILYRDNKDSEPIKRALEKTGVRFVIHSDIDIESDDDMNIFISVLKAVADFGNDEKLTPLLFYKIFNIDHLEAFKILNTARKNRLSLYLAIKNSDFKKAKELYAELNDFSVISKNRGLVEAFETIAAKSGFLTHIISSDSGEEKFRLYGSLLSQVVELAERHKKHRLKEYVDFLNTLERHSVSMHATGFSAVPGKVNLMTAHKSKGLEFDYVYCIGLNDGHWSNKKTPKHFISVYSLLIKGKTEEKTDDIEDERRLLYVALTRAKKEAILSYSKRTTSGRDLLPSELLEEIDAKHISKQVIEKNIKLSGIDGVKVKQNKINAPLKDKKYLSEIFIEEGLSVSALNNYLNCPWKFFFLNLLRIPKAQERHQLYGNAMHQTLKVFFDLLVKDKILSKKELLSFFEKFLNRTSLSDADFGIFLERGKTALSGYYDTYKNVWKKPISTEKNIAGVFVPFIADSGNKVNILIKGNLDKIESNDDGTVSVFDYKTGKPKTKREIIGETKSSDGNYKRQLVFYKLLLDEFDGGRFKMTRGIVDFLEPDKRGRYKMEVFEIQPEEVKALKQKISEVASEIYGMKFWDKRCNDPKCEFCSLTNSIKNSV